MKLRPARSTTRPTEHATAHERPDDLYALFEQSDAESAAAPPPATPSSAGALPARPTDDANFSLSERLARFERPAERAAHPPRQLTDTSLSGADLESRLAGLTITRRRIPQPERIPESPNAETAPKPAMSSEQPPPASQPLVNALPLPATGGIDTAQLAIAALRAAARLAPFVLLPKAERIDTRAAALTLNRLSTHALAAWVEAWGRRPVVQLLRASANRSVDNMLVQHLLADQLAVAMASDPRLAHEVEVLNRALGGRTRDGG